MSVKSVTVMARQTYIMKQTQFHASKKEKEVCMCGGWGVGVCGWGVVVADAQQLGKLKQSRD